MHSVHELEYIPPEHWLLIQSLSLIENEGEEMLILSTRITIAF